MQIPHLNAVAVLAMTSVKLVADVIKELVWLVQVTAIVITTSTALVACQIQTVCGIRIRSLTANPRSNVILFFALLHCSVLRPHQPQLLQQLV